MKKILVISALLLFTKVLFPQNDTLKTYWTKTILIRSEVCRGCINRVIEKDKYTDFLTKNGLSLISKGSFFASDIYSDGFKRGDINVVIDGERYHNACPNRMDPPLTRVNPLSMSLISIYKSNSTLQSGFSGSIEFKRKNPEEKFGLRLGLTGSQINSQSFDAYAGINYAFNSLGLHFSSGKPYKDGDNRDYKTLYNYKENYGYTFSEFTYNGLNEDWKYGASFSHTENILFPYLQMDEIFNNVFSAYADYKSNKIYFNYTNHLMTNELRVSPLYMETKAKNLTAGFFNDYVEFYFRNWLSDNIISSGNSDIINKAIPNLRQFSLSANKDFTFKNFDFSLKGGVLLNFAGSENKDFYNINYPDASLTRLFYRLSASAGYTYSQSKDFALNSLIEFSSEPPEPENLYIAIRRSGTNPWWSGNPDLINPSRITARLNLRKLYFDAELYANYVFSYVNLTKKTTNGRNFMTYENIDAFIGGINFSVNLKYISSELSYTYGQNTTYGIPLSEIAPLRITTNIISPDFYGFTLTLRHIYNNAQTRIDETLKEIKSDAYNVIDIALNWKYNNFNVSLEINNLLNNTYYNYLSYARNPYSSGTKVYESGIYSVLGFFYTF